MQFNVIPRTAYTLRYMFICPLYLWLLARHSATMVLQADKLIFSCVVHTIDAESVCGCNYGQLWLLDSRLVHSRTTSPRRVYPCLGRLWSSCMVCLVYLIYTSCGTYSDTRFTLMYARMNLNTHTHEHTRHACYVWKSYIVRFILVR